MAISWIGKDPNTPDYYIYVRHIETKNPYIIRLFGGKKIKSQKIVSIISSSIYNSLDIKNKRLYTGMTIKDVEEHGTEVFKKQLPEARAKALNKFLGLPT